MGKSWLKKDLSELRKEKREKNGLRSKMERDADARRQKELEMRKGQYDKKLDRLRTPTPKPERKPKGGFTIRVWAKRDADEWCFKNLTKEEVNEFCDEVINQSEGFVRLAGNTALINLDEVTVIRVYKVE